MCFREEFKKTWLTLKEPMTESYTDFRKVTSLRKERLSDGRCGQAPYPELKIGQSQQRTLNDIIHDSSRSVKHQHVIAVSANETYRNKLQQEFYDIQQQNLEVYW